jgi:hypothetical protein
MPFGSRMMPRVLALVLVVHGFGYPSMTLGAQSPYFNTDAGRPLRIEDALPTERYGIDLVLPTARMEHLDAGVTRWRFEPGISYGILPHTEIEVRSTFVEREAAAMPRGGLSSVDFTLMHALNAETLHLPAIALAAEMYVPAGPVRTGGTAFSIRALGTRSGTFGRLHFNASYGSYNVGVVQPASICVYGPNFNIPCSSTGPVFPFIPDGPCVLAPQPAPAMRCNGGMAPPTGGQAGDTVPMRGTHWLAGVGFDHAFALHSTLVMADLYAERYLGLYTLTDWTAEIGARRQFTPTVGVDAGIGRHFRGTSPSWIVTLGATYSAPLRLFGHGVQ